MSELKIKHYLSGLINLDTINLEEKMATSPNLDLFDDKVFIDLSKCRFAELGALTQLILIIESLIKSNHTVYFALPTTRLTERQNKSEKVSELLVSILNQQVAVTNFLKITGFVSALQKIAQIHKNEIYFTEDYDYIKKGEGINIEAFKNSYSVIYDDIIINDTNYKFLLPFKWINCDNGLDEIKNFEQKLDKILENQDRGIERFDVKVIKNVILSELIKNVKNHANTKYAIFVVGLIKIKSVVFERKFKKVNPLEKKQLEYISNSNIKSQVEIYFGDSGLGLLNENYKDNISKVFNFHKTNTKQLLQYSFNKWSTIQDDEPRRGTKGLYRLKRIVNKYKGMVHIKTSKSNGGFFNNQFEYREFKTTFNGTLISIKLNPFKEIKSFKLSTLSRPANKKWISAKYKLDRELKCLDKIKKKILNENNILILIDISSIDLSKDSNILEAFFYEVSFISHPSAIVLYLINNSEDVENDTIELLTDSVQTRINETIKNSIHPEIENSVFEEVHDPVLVIGRNNQTFWYGGSDMLINIINESYLALDSIENIAISQLDSYKLLIEENRLNIINYLESNSSLVVLNKQGELEFNFYGIESHYENKIKTCKPKIEKRNICTPKLSVTKEWIDISDLLEDDEYGFALCLYIKYRKNYEQNGRNISAIDKKNTFILIDHTQQYKLTKKFAELIGLKNKNIRNIEEEIDHTIPKRIKLFNDNSKVIFLTTIVSSSETIRRMVKYVKRDLAIPDVILCMLNLRKYRIANLETWNEKTKILSVFQKHNKEVEKTIKDDLYFEKKSTELKTINEVINPNFEIESDDLLLNSVEINSELLNFITENKFLHYNHYGQNNKRHFTFFLDKKGIVNARENFIHDKIVKVISDWSKKREIQEFTIYINRSLVNKNSYFLQFLEHKFSGTIQLVNIKQHPLTNVNSVYIDFGILTGESINTLISKVDGVDNLLVCLLFNQSINSNANIYKKINTLHYDQRIQLFESERRTVNFDVEYLYNLPLSFFNSETCPICEHRRALDFYKLNEPYFKHFSNDRRERLKQNFADEIYEVAYPIDFYYSEKEYERTQELSSQIIFQMYELKILLENSLKFTKYRIVLFDILYDLYKDIDVELQNSESKIYALLFYLSHEINWLQKEPLVFRNFRILLSYISLKIATINLETLVHHFDTSNHYDIPSRNLATRYKYSAISVLRSSDKLLFNKNIYSIIKTSVVDNIISDNLLQNTLYHISSFFKNSYNRSELYFLEIEHNLQKVISEKTTDSNPQINAIKFILGQNKKYLTKFPNIQNETTSFKKMKIKWESLYMVDMPKHPEPYQELKGLALIQHESTFNAISLNEDQDLSNEKSILIEIIKSLSSRSKNVELFITNNITYYLAERLSLLVRSKYFEDEFSNFLNVVETKRKIEKFNNIIDECKINLNEYLNYKLEYNEIFNYLNDSYIKKKNLGGELRDSKFIDLISEFPSSIILSLNEVFSTIEFPKLKISYFYKQIKLDIRFDVKIYFPQSILKRHLELIKNNIYQKKNAGIELSDIEFTIKLTISDDEYFTCDISYDKTNNWEGTPNTNGSLNTFRTHIEDFGGEFSYIPCNTNNESFRIILKYLRYD